METGLLQCRNGWLKRKDLFKMSEQTKSCNLTEDEISCLIGYHGRSLDNCSAVRNNHSETIERINYLHKRLKEFSKSTVEFKSDAAQDAVNAAAASSWGNS